MKKISHVLSQLPDYLTGSINKSERARIEQHLKTCKSCSSEYTAMAAVWAELGKLPDEMPSQGFRAKFYAALGQYKARYEVQPQPEHPWGERFNSLLDRFWPKQPALQLAVALLCLLIGYVVGFRIDGAGNAANGDVTQLRTEVQNMQKLVMLSLMKTQSASDRIQGVNWSERMVRPDEGVLSALFEALNFDTNVNVRLAALEALSKFNSDTQVRTGLVGSLLRQTSPLIQYALVEVVANVPDKESVNALKELLKNRDLNKTVREQVEKRLKELGV
jgi:hypothetical protein